jgi:hypothetical protein
LSGPLPHHLVTDASLLTSRTLVRSHHPAEYHPRDASSQSPTVINLSIDPLPSVSTSEKFYRHVSRRRRFHHRSVHVVRSRSCCFFSGFEFEGLRSAPSRSQASSAPQCRRCRHRLPRGFATEGLRSAPSRSRLVTAFDGAVPASSSCLIVELWVFDGDTALCLLLSTAHRRRKRSVRP